MCVCARRDGMSTVILTRRVFVVHIIIVVIIIIIIVVVQYTYEGKLILPVDIKYVSSLSSNEHAYCTHTHTHACPSYYNIVRIHTTARTYRVLFRE